MSKSKRRIINEEVTDISPWEFSITLDKLRDRVNELIDQYGADAELDWEPNFYHPYESSPSPRFAVKKAREENDREYADRVARERADNAARETREKAEFERLAKKYGSK